MLFIHLFHKVTEIRLQSVTRQSSKKTKPIFSAQKTFIAIFINKQTFTNHPFTAN